MLYFLAVTFKNMIIKKPIIITTVAELAAHSHNCPDGGPDLNENPFYLNHVSDYSSSQTYDGERTSIVGGDQPHNNLQPYITLNYIIKAL